MKKILGCLFFVLACLAVNAQQAKVTKDKSKDKKSYTLQGSVYDSFTRIPLKAKMFLMDKDSVVLDTTTAMTGFVGKVCLYTFPIEKTAREYIVKAVCQGYEDTYQKVNFVPKGRNFYKIVPNHLMKKKTKNYEAELDEVEVKATRIQMVYRGDTIVYDASAFVLPEGSMLDALVRQLPGAELKQDGSIYVQGKKVDFLTLNGKDLFKGNNKIVLENLPYFTVKDIKVYNKEKNKAKQAIDKNKTDYVMDVNLKREYIRNILSNVEVGAGSEERWMAKMFGLITGERTDVIVYGNLNNLSDAGVPRQDGSWRPENMDKGVKTNREVGATITTSNKKKTMEGYHNIIMRWNDEKIISDGVSETFASEGNVTKKSFSDEKNKYYSLRMNGNTSLNNKKYYWYGDYYVSYDHAKTFSTKRDSTFRGSLVNHNLTLGKIAADYLYAGTNLVGTKELASGDDVMLTFSFNYSYNKPNESFSLNKTHYADTGREDVRNYYGDTHKYSYDYNVELRYDFSLPHKWVVSPYVNYNQSYDERNNFNYRLDWLEDEKYNDLGVLPSTAEELMRAKDADNSYSSRNLYRGYGAGVQLSKSYEEGNLVIVLPISSRHDRFHYMRASLDTIAKRHDVAFSPQLFYSTYGKNPLNVTFQMSMRQPEFADLMPYGDNKDPLNIRINNPDLKRRIEQNFSFYKRMSSDSTDLSRWISVSAHLVQNAWGTRTSYNTKTGAFTYKNDNVNGNWNARASAGFNRTIDPKHRLNLDVNAGLGYNHSVDFAIAYDDKESELSKVNTWTPSTKLSLTYHLNDFRVMAMGQIEGQVSRGNLSDFEDINAYNFTYGGQVQYTIPGVKLTAQTDLMMFSRRGYNASEMNTNDLVWNAQLTRAFWKGNIVAKLQAYDLLHQLSNKVYTVNAQGRTEMWYNTIPRYVMLSLAFKLSKSPKK